jgi:hypothetical protein
MSRSMMIIEAQDHPMSTWPGYQLYFFICATIMHPYHGAQPVTK